MAIGREAGDWFAQLTGFRKTSWHDTRLRLVLDGRHLVSKVDGRRLDHLRALLGIGVHRQADVTWSKRWVKGEAAPTLHSETQVLRSALPVAYGEPPAEA